MAGDWAANVKKYVPDADDGIIAGVVRYCGIALQKRDSSLVSFGDPAETRRVRENFLRKKLALTQSDDKLDAAIAEVGVRMKGEKFRNRVTVYYLLAEQFGKLQVFAKATKAAKAPAAAKGKASATKAAAGTAATVGLASLGASGSGAKAAKAKVTGGVVGAAGAVGTAAIGAAGALASGAVSGAKAVGETAADAVGAVAAGAMTGAKAVGETAAGAAGAAAAMMGSAASAAGTVVNSATKALTGGHADNSDDSKGGWGWLIWLLLAALVIGVLWWLFHGKQAADSGAVVAEQSMAAGAMPQARPLRPKEP